MNELKRCNDTLRAFTACAIAFGLTGCASNNQNQFPKVPLQRLEKDVKIDKNAVQQADEPTLFPFDEIPPYFRIVPSEGYYNMPYAQYGRRRHALREYRHCRER